MNRDAAIEAGARALRAVSARLLGDLSWDYLDEPLRGMYRKRAAAVIDAAAPHLVGEPLQWIVVNHYGDPAYSGIRSQEEALDRARRWNEGRPADSHYRVVALVPVEDQP